MYVCVEFPFFGPVGETDALSGTPLVKGSSRGVGGEEASRLSGCEPHVSYPTPSGAAEPVCLFFIDCGETRSWAATESVRFLPCPFRVLRFSRVVRDGAWYPD